MRADRLLIAAVIFLGGGIYAIFAYCHGTTGLSFGYPINSTRLAIDITTTGLPVLVGVVLLLLGLLLLALAILAALVAPFRAPHKAAHKSAALPGTPAAP